MLRLLALLALAVTDFTGTSSSSYAGRWRLDIARSEGLPPYYAELREHVLDITQTDSSLVVDVTLTDTAGTVRREQYPFSLRAPHATTTSVRTPNGSMQIPTTLTAKLVGDGVEIDIAREITMRGQVVRPMDHESWRLAPGGDTLHIRRELEMPGPGGLARRTIAYVFVREPAARRAAER